MEGHVPLHISAWEGDEVAVKYFYVMKANPNISDKVSHLPNLCLTKTFNLCNNLVASVN